MRTLCSEIELLGSDLGIETDNLVQVVRYMHTRTRTPSARMAAVVRRCNLDPRTSDDFLSFFLTLCEWFRFIVFRGSGHALSLRILQILSPPGPTCAPSFHSKKTVKYTNSTIASNNVHKSANGLCVPSPGLVKNGEWNEPEGSAMNYESITNYFLPVVKVWECIIITIIISYSLEWGSESCFYSTGYDPINNRFH